MGIFAIPTPTIMVWRWNWLVC